MCGDGDGGGRGDIWRPSPEDTGFMCYIHVYASPTRIIMAGVPCLVKDCSQIESI